MEISFAKEDSLSSFYFYIHLNIFYLFVFFSVRVCEVITPMICLGPLEIYDVRDSSSELWLFIGVELVEVGRVLKLGNFCRCPTPQIAPIPPRFLLTFNELVMEYLSATVFKESILL